MAKATLTIAIGGEYNGKAIDKAEQALRSLSTEAARHAGGMTESLTKAGDAIVDLGNNMQHTGDKIANVGMGITKATAPIAAIGAASVKLAADYENAIAKVYTIMDKNVMSTEEMSKSILELSTDTGKSATELSEAAYQALSASVATDKVAGFVEDAVKLSKAGFTETATAVDTLTTVINAYGYSADDAAMISDRLVQTQNKGKTTVDELAQSMGNVIPTASAYNVSLDNLCSAYVIMTKQGINTANATTAINGMLTELANSGSDVAAILQDKTGKSFGQLMAEGKDLGEVIQILSDYVDGDSEAFANLWGNVKASKGALAIANAGASEFTTTMGDMADSTGLCEKALDDLMTPAQKANKAINAMKNTGIELGEEIIGAAVPSLERLDEKAQDLFKWFSELDDGTKQNIVRFGALAVAAGPVVTVFGSMYSGVGKLAQSLGHGLQSIGAFSAAMKTAEVEMTASGTAAVSFGDKVKGAAEKTGLLSKATNLLKGSLAMLGIGGAAAAIGVLVSEFMKWKEHTEQVDKATRGLESAMGAAKASYDSYASSVDGATRALEGNTVTAEKALDSQAQLADKMSQTWSDITTDAAMVDYYASEIERLSKMNRLTAEEQARLTTAVDGFNQLTGSSIEILDAEHGKLNTTKDAILGVAEAYKEEARSAAAKEMLIEINKQQMQDEMALKKAKDELAAAEKEYQYQLENFPDSAYSYGQALLEAERKVGEMESAVASAKQTEQDLLDIVAASPTKFKTMEDALSSCGVSMEQFGDLTEEQLAAMQTNFDGTLSSIYNTCLQQGVNIPNGLAQGIGQTGNNPVEAMGKVAANVVDKVKTIFDSHSPSMVMNAVGQDLDMGLSQGIDASRSKPTNSMDAVSRAVKNAVANLPSYSKTIGLNSGSGMSSGIANMAGSVSSSARSLYSSAANGISATPGTYSSTGWSAASSFSSAIGNSSAYGDGRSLAWSAQDGMASVSAYNTGWNFSVGFANGMNGPSIWNAAYNIGSSALNAIKSALGIASPSKEAEKVGEWFGEGAVLGIEKTEDAVAAESRRMGELMELQPQLYGSYGQPRAYGAYYREPNIAAGNVSMQVNINVNASNAKEGREAGTGIADALYEELSRKMESRLWPVSYSTA